MSKKILIVEDEIFIAEHLKKVLKDLGYDVLGVCVRHEQVTSALQSEKPDLVLLDIQMNTRFEGVEIAKDLNELSIPFVFVTSFSDKQTLQRAVVQSPKGYIVKPFTKEEIQETLTEVFEKESASVLTVSNSQISEKIPFDTILYLHSENVYVNIYTTEKKHVVREKLSDLEKELLPNNFVRSHQSYIVNMDFVTKVTSNNLFVNAVEIPISRKYKTAVLKRID